jgi:hypothetical protein
MVRSQPKTAPEKALFLVDCVSDPSLEAFEEVAGGEKHITNQHQPEGIGLKYSNEKAQNA